VVMDRMEVCIALIRMAVCAECNNTVQFIRVPSPSHVAIICRRLRHRRGFAVETRGVGKSNCGQRGHREHGIAKTFTVGTWDIRGEIR
jgi:hypothetical protein